MVQLFASVGYAPQHRAQWLAKITKPGVRHRAEFYYQQLDALRSLHREVRSELLEESKKHQAWKLLCQIPSIGPIRAAVLLGILQAPQAGAMEVFTSLTENSD